MEKIFTTVELGKHWGVSAETVRRWIEAGELDAIDVSGRAAKRPLWRITLTAVRAFEAQRGIRIPVLMEDL